MSAPSTSSPLWRNLRAAFVAFHLVAITIAASPSPASGLKKGAWKDPTVQDEFALWADRLGMDEREFEDQLWDFAVAFNDARNTVKKPFRPYLNASGTDQTWQMFVAPHMYPTRFELAVDRGNGAWDTIFEERHPTRAWRADLFATERLRATIFRWGWGAYATSYHKGCQALANLMFAEDPVVVRFRCRFWKARSPSPDEARTGVMPPGKFVYPWEVTR